MIKQDRLDFCMQLFAAVINPFDATTTAKIDGAEIPVAPLIPKVLQVISKEMMKNEMRATEILRFLVDAILYTVGDTDDCPVVQFATDAEIEQIKKFYKDR